MEQKKKSKKKIILLLLVVLITSMLLIAIGGFMYDKKRNAIIFEHDSQTISKTDTKKYNKLNNKNKIPKKLKNNNELEFPQNNLDVYREPNSKVNVGFDANGAIEREYWSYTNEYQQTEFLHADQIKPQDNELEKDFIDSEGRYFVVTDDGEITSDQSRPGVISGYDAGHIVADSLGGNSTTYNITPQISWLNQNGIVRQYETDILRNGGAYDFNSRMYYYDDDSLIPNRYYVTYFIDDGDYWTYNEYYFSNADERYY